MRTILFSETINRTTFGNTVNFNEGVMVHKQVEYRDGCVFMRMKKRRFIH